MSTWEITQKSAYLSDFIDLNKNLQKAVVKAVEELEQDPVTPRGNTIKKLQGYENVWHYRLGDFRLIYAVDRPSRLLRLLAIGPRSSVYECFNSGFRWTYVHRDLNVQGRTRILRRNYRSTQEIADAAAEIMLSTDGLDEEAMEQEFVHSGAYPVVYSAKDEADQARWIARRIYDAAREMRLPPNAAAILVPLARDGERLAEQLSEEGLPAVFMRSRNFELEDPHVKVTTLHAAKGLEFPIVVIGRAEEGHLPWEPTATDPQELSEFLHSQRRLFYVGCTRAMRYLFVTHNRHAPSPFLDDLTDDRWMWFDGHEVTGGRSDARRGSSAGSGGGGNADGVKEEAVAEESPAAGRWAQDGHRQAEAAPPDVWEADDVTAEAIEALSVGQRIWLADAATRSAVNKTLHALGFTAEHADDYSHTVWTKREAHYRVYHQAEGHPDYGRALRREA